MTATRPEDRWWRRASLVGAVVVLGFVVVGPLDEAGHDGALTPHVAQHLLLGDIVAPLLLIGLPVSVRRRLSDALERLGRHRPAAALVSPVGALILWGVVTTAWYLPALHREAAPAGPIHVLEQLSIVALGLLFWLAVFDIRPPRDLRSAVTQGGLPWWARHAYAIGSRLLMLPPALIVWFAAGYGTKGQPVTDQVDAASLLIGFEMFLFVAALLATFIAIAIREGRARDDARG